MRSVIFSISIAVMLLTISGCNKFVQIPEPITTITTAETFSTDTIATSAIVGIYGDMAQGSDYADCFMSVMPGLCSDELVTFGGPLAYDRDDLQPNDGNSNNFWSQPYFNIYQANMSLEGIASSTTLSQGTKAELRGEAEFVRAFCYFYLANIFGRVPLATTTSWSTNSTLSRSTMTAVYAQIVADLKDAQNLLLSDYSASQGQRIRPTMWAATAMLARVYLYTGSYDSAITEASSIIANNSLFQLDSLGNVFLANSSEAIWQLQPQYINLPATTYEGNTFVPYDSTSNPNYYLAPELLQAFEPGDQRIVNWVDSTDYSGTIYYYPAKYKVRQGNPGSPPTEYTMMLRLAEQYLIRAEAEAEKGQLANAINDINVIRNRAWLGSLPGNLGQTQVLAAIAQENRIEFFAEWGHRWFDLKRTGQANSVLAPIKPFWESTAQLFPIPYTEIQADPNLIQNPGYIDP